jgi:hypothetical protein
MMHHRVGVLIVYVPLGLRDDPENLDWRPHGTLEE